VRSRRPFLALWTLAVAATVAAFVLHLALRGRNVQMGYALGKARSEQASLREVKRVLELEAATYETPQRVETVARTLLGMQAPTADRIIPIAGMTVTPRDTDVARLKVGSGSNPVPVPGATAPRTGTGTPLASARAER
jgi:cell division protein FtsL